MTSCLGTLGTLVLALASTFAAGPALAGDAATLIQCPDWRQYITTTSGASLRSAPPNQSFEAAVASGRATKAKANRKTNEATKPVQTERGDPLPLPEGFFANAKPSGKPSTSGKPGAPIDKAGVRKNAAPANSQCRYTVVRGDTLGKIAVRTLGSSKRWQEIARANGLTGSSTLRPGQILQLPCAIAGKGPVQAVPLPVWTARPGEYVSDVVKRWAKKAGHTVVHEGVDEWRITVPVSIQGSFKDALKELIVGFEGSGRPLAISIYANKVVRIGRPI